MPGRTTQLRLRRMPQPRQVRDDNARISVEIGETPEKIGAFVQKPVVKREKLRYYDMCKEMAQHMGNVKERLTDDDCTDRA